MTAFIGLSTGCYINNEEAFLNTKVRHIELSSHSATMLKSIIKVIKDKNIHTLSVHCPCPNRGFSVNLESEKDQWEKSKESIIETMEIAKVVNAKYIVIHAFYCLDENLPTNDIQRSFYLNNLDPSLSMSLKDYINSSAYQACIHNTIVNLKSIVPRLKKEYPQQRIVIENLNPRYGYGGILLRDLQYIAEALNGEIGICFDLGHLALTAEALNQDFIVDIKAARDLIWTSHIHQNFGGQYCVDRNWDDKNSIRNLQEIDIHFPLSGRYKLTKRVNQQHILMSNLYFKNVLKGCVKFDISSGDNLQPSVPVDNWLPLLNSTANRVFEYDSRYAPLDHIIEEIRLAEYGNHPCRLF